MPDEDARNSTWWCRCQSVWIKWLVQATTWRSSMKLAGFGNSTGASSDAEILSSRSRLRTLPANRRHCHVEPMLHVGMRHDRLVIRVSRTMQVKSIKNPQPISNIGRMYWNARDGTEQWNATEERHRSRWWVKYSSAFVFFCFNHFSGGYQYSHYQVCLYVYCAHTGFCRRWTTSFVCKSTAVRLHPNTLQLTMLSKCNQSFQLQSHSEIRELNYNWKSVLEMKGEDWSRPSGWFVCVCVRVSGWTICR